MNLFKEIIAEDLIEKEFNSFEEYLVEAKNKAIELLSTNNLNVKDVISSTLSLPGPINKNTNIIEYLNFGFKNINFSLIKNILFDNIYIENEANLALLHEMDSNNIKEKSVVYLSINEGFGAGIYNDNTFLKSNIGYAGEIGSLIVDYKNKVTVEDIVSSIKIINSYNRKSNIKVNSFEDFFIEVKNNNPIAIDIYNEVIDIIKVAINNVTMILDPSVIIVGGKIPRRIIEINNNSNYNPLVTQNFKNLTKVALSSNKNSTTKGAALYALKRSLGQI